MITSTDVENAFVITSPTELEYLKYSNSPVGPINILVENTSEDFSIEAEITYEYSVYEVGVTKPVKKILLEPLSSKTLEVKIPTDVLNNTEESFYLSAMAFSLTGIVGEEPVDTNDPSPIDDRDDETGTTTPGTTQNPIEVI